MYIGIFGFIGFIILMYYLGDRCYKHGYEIGYNHGKKNMEYFDKPW